MDFIDDDLLMGDHLVSGFGLGPMDGSVWGADMFGACPDGSSASYDASADSADAPEHEHAAEAQAQAFDAPVSPQQPLLSPGTASSTPLDSAGSSPSLVGSSPMDAGSVALCVKEEVKREPAYMSPATAAAAQAAAEAARAAVAALAPASMITPCAPEKKRRGKRKRDDEAADPAALRVRLPRDTLLRMSSSEVQNYMHQLSEERTLTAPEERELKRLKRLVKNRESAQLSRQRKRDYVDKLEIAIRELSAEHHNTKYELSRSRAETEAMRENVRRLTRVIEEALAPMPVLAEPQYPEPTPMPPVVLPVMEEGDDPCSPSQPEDSTPACHPPQAPAPTPQQPQQPQQPQRPVAYAPFVAVPPAMLPVPHVKLPIPEKVQQIIRQQEQQVQQMHQFQHRPPPMARGLKTAGVCALIVLFSFGLFFNAQSNDQRFSGITFGRHSPRLVARPATIVAQPQARAIQSVSDQPAPPAVFIQKADQIDRQRTATALVPVGSGSSRAELPTTDLVLSNANIQATLAKSWTPKNISYMMCNNVTRYDPPAAGLAGTREDSCVLGFLVPYSSINGSDGKMYAGPEDYVEILCKVIDVNIIPHHAMPLKAN
eukprot:m51a1_g2753 putative basic-leucine zipper transcription factor (601) ;mRNA; f:964113-966325